MSDYNDPDASVRAAARQRDMEDDYAPECRACGGVVAWGEQYCADCLEPEADPEAEYVAAMDRREAMLR